MHDWHGPLETKFSLRLVIVASYRLNLGGQLGVSRAHFNNEKIQTESPTPAA